MVRETSGVGYNTLRPALVPSDPGTCSCMLVVFASCALNNGAILLIQEKMAGGVVAGDSEKA